MNNTSSDIWGYEISIEDGKAHFYMGTESGLDVNYHDPDFLEKFQKALRERLKVVMGWATWPLFDVSLSPGGQHQM